MLNQQNIDPLLCPLCNQANSCVNLSTQDVKNTCWCNDPTIAFPEALLSQIPDELRRKACVCRSCVIKFHNSKRQTS